MDDFCWLTGPELCGRLSFDLPVIEVFVVALVSGLVTWATIHFSVRAARRETERTLAAHEMTELRAAILAIAQDADESYQDAYWNARNRSVDANAAEITIRTSGKYGASDAVKWARLFRQYSVAAALEKQNLYSFATFFNNWGDPSIGPGGHIIERLSEWLSEPEKTVPGLSKQIRDFEIMLVNFVNEINSEDSHR